MGCSIHNQPRATPELTGDLAQAWLPKVDEAAQGGVEDLKKLWRKVEGDESLSREEVRVVRAAIERKRHRAEEAGEAVRPDERCRPAACRRPAGRERRAAGRAELAGRVQRRLTLLTSPGPARQAGPRHALWRPHMTTAPVRDAHPISIWHAAHAADARRPRSLLDPPGSV